MKKKTSMIILIVIFLNALFPISITAYADIPNVIISGPESKERITDDTTAILVWDSVNGSNSPSEEDLKSIESGIEYPEKTEYLDHYNYGVVQAPGGHSVYCYGSADMQGSKYTVADGAEVVIIARRGQMLCVIIPALNKARWIREANIQTIDVPDMLIETDIPDEDSNKSWVHVYSLWDYGSATDRFSEIIQPLPDIACGLRTDGTVAVMEMRQDASSAGNAERSAFKDTVEKWSDVNKIAVLGNMNGIAGIKNDGSVLIEVILEDYMDDSEKDYKECQEWKDIADIVSNSFGTFGLKTDGTVTATSGTIRYFEENYQRKFTFDTWKDIKEIHLSTNMNGDYLLLGLSGDGTLYYNGASYFAKDWNGVRNIAAVDIGAYVYLLLREDGTVDASGINCGEWTGTVYKWKEIIQTIAGESAAAGLNNDGTVVVAGTGYPENLKWDDVSKLYFDADDNLYGVCKNGTVKICLRSDAYQYYKADRESVKTWNDIEKLSFLYDIENQEMTIVGIRKDGSIVNTEEVLNESIKSNAVDTQSYSDIIQTFDGDAICALRLDGTVKVVELLPGDKDNDAEFGRFKENVEKWTDIKKIVRIGGLGGIAGIKENGDVVLELMDDDYFERMHGECREWHGIEDIISGDSGTFGLKKDGTVIATEATIRFRENTSSSNYIFDTWKDIVTIKGPEYCLGGFGFFGLSRDGVLYHDGFSILNDWNGLKNIADIEGTTGMFLALRKDGTVYPDRNMSDWKDIIQIRAGEVYAAGIRSDGSVLVTDHSIDNQTVILDWPEVISIYFGLNDTLFGVCKDGTIRCYVPKLSNDLSPYINLDEINAWNGIVKLSLVYDYYKNRRNDEQSEIIVIGYREDGSIVSTRDLSL